MQHLVWYLAWHPVLQATWLAVCLMVLLLQLLKLWLLQPPFLSWQLPDLKLASWPTLLQNTFLAKDPPFKSQKQGQLASYIRSNHPSCYQAWCRIFHNTLQTSCLQQPPQEIILPPLLLLICLYLWLELPSFLPALLLALAQVAHKVGLGGLLWIAEQSNFSLNWAQHSFVRIYWL